MEILWLVSNIGPYHDARFAELGKMDFIDLHVVEFALAQKKYPWSRKSSLSYSKSVLFPEGKVEDHSSFAIAIRLLRKLRSAKPDVVVVNGYSDLGNIVVAIASRLTGRTALTIFDTTEGDHPRHRWKELFKGLGVRNLYDGIFCSGARSREYLLKMGVPDERIQGGVDVVDNAHFTMPREHTNPSLPAGSFFLSVTRFSPEKNTLQTIESYRRYCEKAEDPWPLVLCGSGPQDAMARQSAARISSGEVIFLGFTAYNDLPEVYQRAGCLILPSLSEPWGLVVNEAMAAGTPVIVSDRCGCVPDLVHHGQTGFVFDPRETGALSQLMTKIAALPDDERKTMGQKGREVIGSYTPETWARNLLELVERVHSMKRRFWL